MNMIRGQRFFYQSPEGDGGAPGGGAAAGQQGGGQQQQGGQQGGFADANSARSFLAENLAGDAEFLKSVPDDKVMPWATRAKTKFEEMGKQFPGNWRDQIAGEDKNHLKTLETFASPKALYNSYAALRGKLSSGELKAVVPFPTTGTDVEKATWRKDNGIPETAEGYTVQLPKGGVLGEKDKVWVSEFQKAAHAVNMRPEHFQASVLWQLGERQRQTDAVRDADNEFKLNSEDELRAEWGQGYRENLNRLMGFLDTAPKGLKEIVMGARGPDGKPLGSHPAVLRWLVDLARQQNPSGVLLPGAGGNMAKSIGDEIATIEKTMRENRKAYNKDEAMQKRYRDLLDARDKLQQKKAA